MAADYRIPLAQLRASLREKKQQRSALDLEIKRLEGVIEGLTELTAGDGAITAGVFTKLDAAILEIFSADRTSKMPPRQVLRRLEKKKFDLSNFSNRAAYIHGSLKRLVKKGKLEVQTIEDSDSMYWWKGDTQSKVAEISPNRAAQ